ncbi:amylo-alpha-1,6-glucosidase [Ramlibacter humi]|uniref:Amylo-alpha-1,6-glucosidase n=1 Tax=Ramlibacter humi TaxID=2530451 RepID=A0A4Z0CEB6_9BURK|nr:glycogen debranching N-terminal domain-containing protein [Ramlibacter humi]TFZ08755.1 amylo-alpha-1,6-glucosidase [Ramlibacter humi]
MAEKKKILVDDRWYVLAAFARPEEQPQTVKNGHAFAMFDRTGDVGALAPGQEGLYHEDTRYLSYQELTINGLRPLYLGSSVQEANSLLAIDLMNPDLTEEGRVVLPKGELHLFRAKLLWQGACYEHVRVSHHGTAPLQVRLEMAFDADFIDLFEIRGMHRQKRGERLPAEVTADRVMLPYRGLDATLRRTGLRFEPAPQLLEAHRAAYDVTLKPGEEKHLYLTVTCEREGQPVPVLPNYFDAFNANNASRRETAQAASHVVSSNPLVNLWLDRSVSDLAMLVTELPTGPYPFAGVPWYSTTFGRDGILTALEYLWVDASMACGVLNFLASTQATQVDAERDAEPGKILHEARPSEMARTREIPFGRYYGTVDATPLFLVLAAAYWRRTGDQALMRKLWPNLLAALKWIDDYGDADGDGFVEYARKSADGLTQQGWKDSQDSVFHRDGRLADAPIALCEVQGYVYQAKQAMAEMAQAFGDGALAARLRQQAQDLQVRFQSAFWSEERGTYALALDGAKRRCDVLASNVGHCLWSGIASPEHGARVADLLMGSAFFSGWGVRTIAEGEARYNPMSYHNGSIWPHDNALAAMGLARYGRTEDAMHLLAAMFESSLHFDLHRLPELFCGFPRRHDAGPTLYPVACSPQAWAAAAPFAVLQACLGLEIDGATREVCLRTPRLPAIVDWLRIERLGSPGASCDLLLTRHERSVGVEVLRKDEGVTVRVLA